MNFKPEQQFLNLYFQVHQPRRLGKFSFFDIGSGRDYFDDATNEQIMQRVAENCYLPTNLLLLKLINKYPQIRVTFSISGAALKQFERFTPDVVESFRMLATSGSVEFLGETYYHSLAYLVSHEEFGEQVHMHSRKMDELFGVRPVVFRNTDLIYSDDIGRQVEALGFKGTFTDGINKIAERRQNHLYRHPERGLRIFLRNSELSDAIAYRFLQEDRHLTAEKYIEWLEQVPKEQSLITLGMDYATFGEHQKATTGILKFLEDVLSAIAQHKRFSMITPSEAIELIRPLDTLTVPSYISWTDHERDLSAWVGNDMQQDAFRTLSEMEGSIKNIGNRVLLNTWRYLQSSDHFYYMSTKNEDDGVVRNYFSPYSSPYDAFMNYMNVLSDLVQQIEKLNDVKVELKEHIDIFGLNHTTRKWRPEALTF
ncbi:MAG TPA: glycoside hydrolase family 57 protein [Cyclobacteriaceae bacterium]|nr:glycoside hydrolase family 57 protein [Cyclobacteriaceae bacterium]